MSGTPPARRDRILSAATEEFANYGFAGARVDRIAAAAGVNKQLLFHYFGSKDGLHRAAVASVLERFDPSAKPGRLPVERMREIIAQLLAATEMHPPLLSMLAATETHPDASPKAIAIAAEWRMRGSLQTEQVLKDAQRAGYIRDDVDPKIISEIIVAASLGWAAASGGEESSPTADRTHQFGEMLLRMVLDYCTWR